jgi:GH43 family beta-xylosidase
MTETYLNPVFDHPAPDPFVFKHRGEYWCISSHCEPGERKFQMLRAADLVHWEIVGGALEPLAEDHPCYWAPEITYDNGAFYLYYSVGNETFMQLRVATARVPQGPYVDAGVRLTPQDFAIDAHVFVDEDGARWLFYATDFLEHTRIGTGTVVDRLIDPFTLEGNPRPVSRARYDWQVYDPARESKGGVKWHTIEGSFTLKRKGRYYQMFSGGNWTNQTYGVGYAVSEAIERPDEWDQPCNGEATPLVLRTLPGLVTGPGHNSVIRGPDNCQLYCVYHRWVDGARVLSIDPLDWAGERLLALGPTHTPQPAPRAPAYRGFAAAHFDGGQCETGFTTEEGNLVSGVARQTDLRKRASASWQLPAPQFLLEVAGRVLDLGDDAVGSWGVDMLGEKGRVGTLAIRPRERTLTITVRSAQRAFPLPADFDGAVDHLLRVEVDGARVTAMVDTIAARFRLKLPFEPYGVALFTDGLAAEFAAPEITPGWEELFDGPEKTPDALDWDADKGWAVAGGELRSPELRRGGSFLQRGPKEQRGLVAKAAPTETYELVMNVRLVDALEGGGYALFPAGAAGAPYAPGNGPNLFVRRDGDGWRLEASAGSTAPAVWPLPAGFDAQAYQHWRFRVGKDAVAVALEGQTLGELRVESAATHLALAAVNAQVACEMVRVTGM